MKKYDILIFQETKTTKFDHLNLPNGYSYKAKHGEKCTRKSGGYYYIQKPDKFLEFPESSSRFAQWLRINNDFINIQEYLVVGCVHVLPREYKVFTSTHLTKSNLKCSKL